jgi:hypothetical protein
MSDCGAPQSAPSLPPNLPQSYQLFQVAGVRRQVRVQRGRRAALGAHHDAAPDAAEKSALLPSTHAQTTVGALLYLMLVSTKRSPTLPGELAGAGAWAWRPTQQHRLLVSSKLFFLESALRYFMATPGVRQLRRADRHWPCCDHSRRFRICDSMLHSCWLELRLANVHITLLMKAYA